MAMGESYSDMLGQPRLRTGEYSRARTNDAIRRGRGSGRKQFFFSLVASSDETLESVGMFDPDTQTRRMMTHRFPSQVAYVLSEEGIVIRRRNTHTRRSAS